MISISRAKRANHAVRAIFAVSLMLMGPRVGAQTFELTSADVADSAALSKSIPRLAREVLAAYQEPNRERYLDNLFRLQILTGRYGEAASTIAERRSLLMSHGGNRLQDRALYVQYEIFAKAREAANKSGRPFTETFAEAFRQTYAHLDNAAAAWTDRAILTSPRTVAGDLRWATPDQQGKTRVALDDALTLLKVYSAVESYRAFAGLPAALVAEDDARRYSIETNVAVRTPDGATVCAIIVRPRAATGKLPTLLQFTIYADSITSMRDALLTASRGYAGVTGHTRGKACSSDKTVPYAYDGADATALINWIAAQPWSDGRVGMYGGSYSGFTTWATTKYMPKPLKAIMVGAPVAPGIDVPMEGNIVWNFIYPWPFYTTNNRWLDNAMYFDNARWSALNEKYYRTGAAYRGLAKLDGTPNPVFAEWIRHPSVDAYWSATIPRGKEYASINIPVLQTAGYFAGGPGGAIYYFQQHYKYNPRAQHYLLLGPWDHPQAQRGVVTTLGDTASYIAGYITDPVSQIDILADVRYQWFDHVLKGAPIPSLLKDRVNYEVMGANVWKHAPSLTAVSNDRMRFYLDPTLSGSRYTLASKQPPADASLTLRVNLADRSDADSPNSGGGFLAASIDTSNAVVLTSDPVPNAIEVSGLLSGHLELMTNKKDFDFTVTLYELNKSGEYFQLPPYMSRASHVESVSTRRLLTPGKRERLSFVSPFRAVSRQISEGSRIVMVLGIVKNSGQQINYGTGKDVSDESIADAGEPLTIRWLGGSYIDLPVHR